MQPARRQCITVLYTLQGARSKVVHGIQDYFQTKQQYSKIQLVNTQKKMASLVSPSQFV
jgi:hypothetical protein